MTTERRSMLPQSARRRHLAVGLALVLALLTPLGGQAAGPIAAPAPAITVVASGLNNPRELKFNPDGTLYVAEGGTGGTNATGSQCQQVPAPVGPYTGNITGGGIATISRAGVLTRVATTLPSSQTTPASGGFVSGVADLAFMGNTLYALEAGAGCSHGVPGVPNGVFRVNADGAATLVANLSAFQMTNPVAHPEPDDFEPDGTWYSMLRVGGDLYAVEPNHGELDRIDPRTGQVSRVADISASQGHIVPTALAYHDGDFYVGNLNTFPVQPGSAKILRITRSGEVSVVVTGLTTVLGLDFDAQGTMYAAEMSTAVGNPAPASGMVVRIDRAGQMTTVASGLTFPTGLTVGPDGQVYVSEHGLGFPPGAGQVVRINVGPPPVPGLPNTGGGGAVITPPSAAVVSLVAALAVGGTLGGLRRHQLRTV
jgi:hypothetical protein